MGFEDESTLLGNWKQLISATAARDPAADEPGAVDLAMHPTLLPRLLESYTPPKVRPHEVIGKASVDYGCLLVRLSIILSPERDEKDYRYWLSRRIVEADRRAEHRNLYLPTGLQGWGVGRALWKQALDLYEELGCVDVVWVESERVGRYANISSGVEFQNDEERRKVIDAVAQVAASLDIQIDASALEHPWDVAAITAPTSRAQMEAAGFDLDPEARFDDEEAIPLAKAALLSDACPSWRGRISLDPTSESYRRLKAYIGA